jgi:hypothetical protein
MEVPVMDHVFAITSTVIGSPQGTVRIHEGEAWASDDPIVAANPSLFGEKPTKLRRTTQAPAWVPQEEAPVEEATAAPAEKRTTKRAPKRD